MKLVAPPKTLAIPPSAARRGDWSVPTAVSARVHPQGADAIWNTRLSAKAMTASKPRLIYGAPHRGAWRRAVGQLRSRFPIIPAANIR